MTWTQFILATAPAPTGGPTAELLLGVVMFTIVVVALVGVVLAAKSKLVHQKM